MTRSEAEEILKDQNPEALFADGFDDAILGVARRINLTVVAYNEDRCIEILMKQGMTLAEAYEHFDFNVAGSWVGEHTPVFITLSEENR